MAQSHPLGPSTVCTVHTPAVSMPLALISAEHVTSRPTASHFPRGDDPTTGKSLLHHFLCLTYVAITYHIVSIRLLGQLVSNRESPFSSASFQSNMSVSLSTIWTQYFPPEGPITEANLPSQTGKVFIVTGGSNGLGYELSRQLYGAGGKVYILTRSKERTETSIAKIKAHYQEEDAAKQCGSLHFIQMDLMDFASVKTAAQEFLAREGPNGRLDVL